MDGFDKTVDAPRTATDREWEVFCRETAAEPLRHAGSVTAPSGTVALEQAARLFGHAAEALWLCPTDETLRVQDGALGIGTPEESQSEDTHRTAVTPCREEEG